MMPTRFDALPTATWPRLRALLDGHAAGGEVINMTIGEPKHTSFPEWVGPTSERRHSGNSTAILTTTAPRNCAGRLVGF